MNQEAAEAAFQRHLRAVTGLYVVVEYPPHGTNVLMITPDRAKADAYAEEIRATAWWAEPDEFGPVGKVEVQKVHPGDKIDIGYNK